MNGLMLASTTSRSGCAVVAWAFLNLVSLCCPRPHGFPVRGRLCRLETDRRDVEIAREE